MARFAPCASQIRECRRRSRHIEWGVCTVPSKSLRGSAGWRLSTWIRRQRAAAADGPAVAEARRGARRVAAIAGRRATPMWSVGSSRSSFSTMRRWPRSRPMRRPCCRTSASSFARTRRRCSSGATPAPTSMACGSGSRAGCAASWYRTAPPRNSCSGRATPRSPCGSAATPRSSCRPTARPSSGASTRGGAMRRSRISATS